MGIGCIDDLGRQIEDAWRSAEYSVSAFPELAEKMLRQYDLPAQLSVKDIVDWALRAPALPVQADMTENFGQPPVTIFRGTRFYVDALFWVDGTTTIHQHGFSGAFQVLAGSSIETLFSFATERMFDGHFVIGDLGVLSSNLLRQGDVRPIWSGSKLIHSLFHLDRPSVTIVVRTGADPGVGPQFSYVRSGIARNPFFVDEVSDRKLQIGSMLRRTGHPSFETLVGDLIADSDVHTAYRVVREYANHGIVDRLIDRVRDKVVAERFRSAVKDHRRDALLIGRRNMVADADLRFFLGLLLNAPRRRDVLTVAGQRMSGVEPARQVAFWLRQLSNVTIKLQADGAPWQPNVLGLPVFDDEIEHACVGILNGQTSGWGDEVAAAVAQLRALPALACLFND